MKTTYSFDDMLAFAKVYASLGDALTEQLDDILSMDHERFAEINYNAVKEIRRAFDKGAYGDFDSAIAEYEVWRKGQSGS